MFLKKVDLADMRGSKNQFKPVGNKWFLVKKLVCKIKKEPNSATWDRYLYI